MSDAPPALVRFRRNLRIADNAAFAAAAFEPVAAVFHWSPEDEGGWAPGAASRRRLRDSLLALRADLARMGVPFLLAIGPAGVVLPDLARRIGAKAVFLDRAIEPAPAAADALAARELARDGIATRVFDDSMLFAPESLSTKTGTPYKVFTPFWNECRARGVAPEAAPFRVGVRGFDAGSLASDARFAPLSEATLDRALGLPLASASPVEGPMPGEAGAARALERFLSGPVADYEISRDRLAAEGVSGLSEALHFGEISPARVWRDTLEFVEVCGDARARASAWAFVRQIAWREFAIHLLHHFPHTTDRPLRPEFERFPWLEAERAPEPWTRGETGFPAADAALRELAATGRMHNRARMIVASLLTKDLLVHWRAGARHFWETLADADLANNTLGWQWVAGCGADAAPYFRIFNPTAQGEKFDPDGAFVRRWVPELARLPDKWIHRPAEAPAAVLAKAGVAIGKTYPAPIVDRRMSRERALSAYAAIKG